MGVSSLKTPRGRRLMGPRAGFTNNLLTGMGPVLIIGKLRQGMARASLNSG